MYPTGCGPGVKDAKTIFISVTTLTRMWLYAQTPVSLTGQSKGVFFAKNPSSHYLFQTTIISFSSHFSFLQISELSWIQVYVFIPTYNYWRDQKFVFQQPLTTSLFFPNFNTNPTSFFSIGLMPSFCKTICRLLSKCSWEG